MWLQEVDTPKYDEVSLFTFKIYKLTNNKEKNIKTISVKLFVDYYNVKLSFHSLLYRRNLVYIWCQYMV